MWKGFCLNGIKKRPDDLNDDHLLGLTCRRGTYLKNQLGNAQPSVWRRELLSEANFWFYFIILIMLLKVCT